MAAVLNVPSSAHTKGGSVSGPGLPWCWSQLVCTWIEKAAIYTVKFTAVCCACM